MSESLDPTMVPAVAPGFRLQWEEAQDCYVILYPEGMVKLSVSAGEIMKRCGEENSIAQITEQLVAQYPDADLTEDVNNFFAAAVAKGWLCDARNQ